MAPGRNEPRLFKLAFVTLETERVSKEMSGLS